MKKLSIIIPCYNVEGYIEECLLSLIRQLTDDVECIVIDDGSTDKTFEIVRELSIRSENRIRFVKLAQNHGVSRARNIGLEFTNGEYVAFVDADDYVSKDYIKTILRAIVSKFDYYTLSWVKIEDSRKFYADMLPSWNCAVWARVFKREIIKKKFNEKLSWAEDWQFLEDNMIGKLKKGHIMPFIYFYRSNRTGSLTSKNVP